MIRYLIICENFYSSKNKLEEQVKQYLKLQNRKLIASSQIEKFKQQVLSDIEKINTQNAKCKAVKCEWWSPSREEDVTEPKNWILSFGSSSICIFKAYAGKEVDV